MTPRLERMFDLHGGDVGPSGGPHPRREAAVPPRDHAETLERLPIGLGAALARKQAGKRGHAVGGGVAIKAVEVPVKVVHLDVKRPALEGFRDGHVAGHHRARVRAGAVGVAVEIERRARLPGQMGGEVGVGLKAAMAQDREFAELDARDGPALLGEDAPVAPGCQIQHGGHDYLTPHPSASRRRDTVVAASASCGRTVASGQSGGGGAAEIVVSDADTGRQ